MKIVSKISSPIFIKFPSLKWFALLISMPFVIFIYFLIPLLFIVGLLEGNNSIWIMATALIAFSYIIPYLNVKRGWGQKQIIELKDSTLIVKTKWFLLFSKKRYLLDNIELKEVNFWNYLTGQSIELPSKYCRIVINNETTLHHIYNKDDLDHLLKTYANHLASN